MRLILIYISDYKLYRGLRGATHIFSFKKGQHHHRHHNQTMDKVHLRSYLFSRILENFMITTVIITIALLEGLPMAVVLTLAFFIKK